MDGCKSVVERYCAGDFGRGGFCADAPFCGVRGRRMGMGRGRVPYTSVGVG